VHPQLISKSIAQNENRRITRHLKLRETSVIRMESVQSNKSLDSVDRVSSQPFRNSAIRSRRLSMRRT
jgi:hypothetical protein